MGTLEANCGTIQITMYAKISSQRRSEVAAGFVSEGESRANEGWTMFPIVLSQIFADVDRVLFDSFLKE